MHAVLHTSRPLSPAHSPAHRSSDQQREREEGELLSAKRSFQKLLFYRKNNHCLAKSSLSQVFLRVFFFLWSDTQNISHTEAAENCTHVAQTSPPIILEGSPVSLVPSLCCRLNAGGSLSISSCLLGSSSAHQQERAEIRSLHAKFLCSTALPSNQPRFLHMCWCYLGLPGGFPCMVHKLHYCNQQWKVPFFPKCRLDLVSLYLGL